ncbi:hypothetical protein EWM64_g3424 [Hericium alpestre]|uniref:HNH nuclease domain-containing protein n=1 Tax=Hericium alpestre TaxID=135208 RepID=A0A4Z0A4I4_9AGAM|nr:hypothetical protein EWM64_g3424 [Hericium alpestre]
MVKPAHGNIWFALISEKELPLFYLDLNISLIQNLCLKPVKYLRYLAWCILGMTGPETAILFNNVPVDDDEDLVERGTYYFSAPGLSNFIRILDEKPNFKHVKMRNEAYTVREWYKFEYEENEPPSGFRGKLMERDSGCVFISLLAETMHIIEEDALLQRVINDRSPDPSTHEDLSTLDVDDIRNGFLILNQTPNCILGPEDIPTAAECHVSDTDSYPAGRRYSLQWLEGDPVSMAIMPNNLDAKFRKDNHGALPSAHLLAFHYGQTAVERWGRGWQDFLFSYSRAVARYPLTRRGRKRKPYHAADFLLLLCQYKPDHPLAQAQA